jgi:hypothetical protein
MAIDINIPSQVKNYANLAGFPATGSLKTIFIAEDTNKTYRWTGSAYVEISASQAASWGSITGTLSSQTDLQTALNAKQDSLGFTPVPTSRTLTINGTTQDLSADRTFTISTGITIGTTAITSGTVGRVLFQGSGNVVQQSSSLFWDSTNNRLGIGTSSPEMPLHINTPSISFFKISQASRTGYIQFTNGTSGTSAFQPRILGVEQGSNLAWELVGQCDSDSSADLPAITLDARNASSALSNRILFGIGSYILNLSSYKFLVRANGNIGINTTTDAGFKLDVNGTARVDQTLQLNATTSGTAIAFGSNIGRFTIDGNFIRFKAVNGGDMLNMTSNFLGIFETSVVPSAVVSIASTTRGFLPPRQTQAQRTAIASPAVGLVVYQTDGTEGLYVNKSTGWALLL